MIDAGNDLRSGDLVMSRDTGGGWLGAMTRRVCGSVSDHNELICREPGGSLAVGWHHPPAFEFVPWEERMADVEAGRRAMAVVRWHEFGIGSQFEATEFILFQERVRAAMRMAAECRIPYSFWSAGMAGVNALFHRPGRRAGPLFNLEWTMHCTEGCVKECRAADLDFAPLMAGQRYPAPIHFEKLYLIGHLVLVLDLGLMRYFAQPEAA
jgi:hypothetical protein